MKYLYRAMCRICNVLLDSNETTLVYVLCTLLLQEKATLYDVVSEDNSPEIAKHGCDNLVTPCFRLYVNMVWNCDS